MTRRLVPGRAYAARGPLRHTIFDVAGRRVAAVRGQAGQQLVWEGRNGAGIPVPPGIYLWRLEAGHHVQEGRFVVVR